TRPWVTWVFRRLFVCSCHHCYLLFGLPISFSFYSACGVYSFCHIPQHWQSFLFAKSHSPYICIGIADLLILFTCFRLLLAFVIYLVRFLLGPFALLCFALLVMTGNGDDVCIFAFRFL